MAVLELGQRKEMLSGCAAIHQRGRRCAWRCAEGSGLDATLAAEEGRRWQGCRPSGSGCREGSRPSASGFVGEEEKLWVARGDVRQEGERQSSVGRRGDDRERDATVQRRGKIKFRFRIWLISLD